MAGGLELHGGNAGRAGCPLPLTASRWLVTTTSAWPSACQCGIAARRASAFFEAFRAMLAAPVSASPTGPPIRKNDERYSLFSP